MKAMSNERALPRDTMPALDRGLDAAWARMPAACRVLLSGSDPGGGTRLSRAPVRTETETRFARGNQAMQTRRPPGRKSDLRLLRITVLLAASLCTTL
jgi:hypothetical protein